MTSHSMAAAVADVQRRIEAAARRSGREYEAVTLIAASKSQRWESLWDAFDEGAHCFGENYLQEAIEKMEMFHAQGMTDLPRWHFLGHLQSRKAKEAAGRFDLIHSVDSFELAQRLDHAAADKGLKQEILLQVNVGGEPTKSGCEMEAVSPLVTRFNDLPNVRLRGLMNLPPYQESSEEMRPYHRALRELRDDINARALYRESLPWLSMGMSHDFEIAIEEGATHIRVGESIFGERPLREALA